MQWYYLSDTHERIALSDAQFPVLAARGVLRPATPVWRKGMADWTACGEVMPEIFTAAVTRDSDQRMGLTDHTAAKGTIVGVARTLAGYRVWMRILAGLTLAVAIILCGLLGWETWTLIKYGTEALGMALALGVVTGWETWTFIKFGAPNFDTAPMAQVRDQVNTNMWALWVIIAIQVVTAVLAVWAALILLQAASRSRAARESGSEPLLHLSLRGVGHYAVLCVVGIVLNLAVWISLSLWFSRNLVFPAPGPPPAPKVII